MFQQPKRKSTTNPIMSKADKIRKFYQVLHKHYGPQNWWPAESTLECIVGAILTQNTSWENASRAVERLKSQGIMTVEALNRVSEEQLATLIRSSGYYNQKAKKIKRFIRFLNENFSGDLEAMFNTETSRLREMLLGIKGIGPETADSILLYAGNKPVFVVDKYTYRILNRHGIIPEDASYHEMQELLTQSLKEDADLFNEYHALIVRVGKEHCGKKAQCKGCPLEYDLS